MKTNILKVIIVLLIIINPLLSNAYVCYLKINFNDCQTCIGNINEVERISSKLNPTFVFKDYDTSQIGNLLSERYNFNMKGYNFIISDSIFNSLSNSVRSEVIVFDRENNLILYKTLLAYLKQNLKQLNSYAFNNTKVSVLADLNKIYLSDNLSISTPGNRILIFDNVTNKYYIIRDSNAEEFVSGKTIDKKFIHVKYFGDTNGYYTNIYFKDDLLEVGRRDLDLGQIIYSKGFYYCFITYYYPEIVNKNNHEYLKIGAKFLIGKFNDNKLVDAYKVEYPRLPYDIDQYNYFFIRNNEFYLPVFKDELGRVNKFLGIYKLNNGELEYLKPSPHKLPDYFEKNNLQYDFTDFKLKNDYLFFTVCNEVFNFSTRKVEINLEAYDSFNSFVNLEKPRINFDLFDLRNTLNYVQILIHADDKVKILYLDHITKKQYRVENLPINYDSLIAFPVFYQDGIILITKNKKLIKLTS